MDRNEKNKRLWRNAGVSIIHMIVGFIIGILLHSSEYYTGFVDVQIIVMIMKICTIFKSVLAFLGVGLLEIFVCVLKNKNIHKYMGSSLFVVSIMWCIFLGISWDAEINIQEELVSMGLYDEEISSEDLEYVKNVMPYVTIVVINDDSSSEIIPEREYRLTDRETIDSKPSDIMWNLFNQLRNRYKYGRWLYAEIKITAELVPEEGMQQEKDAGDEVNLIFWDELIALDDSHIAYLNGEQEHGDIRYKLDGGEWSNWISIDLEEEFVVSTDKKSISCIQWKQGGQTSESRNIEDNEIEMFFIDRGGFRLNDKVLKQLFYRLADESQGTNYKSEIKISGYADRVKCIGWKNDEVSISFDENNSLYMKAGDEILYRCFVDNSLIGTYKAYLSKKGGDESVKWVEVSEDDADQSLVILDIYFDD